MKSEQETAWRTGKASALRLWLPLGLLLLAMVACGGFQVRVTPTAVPTPTPEPPTAEALSPTAEPTLAQSTPALPTPVPLGAPTQVPEPTAGGAGLAPGKIARVTAGGGLNMRDRAVPAATGRTGCFREPS
jgi:hypothetical protein